MQEGVSNELVESDCERYPLKRLEFRMKKFNKVTSCHLDILKKQKLNIEKYQMLELWRKVELEQANASRTVQQLKADIEEMELLAQQILEPRDLPLFRERVEPIRREILQAIETFLALHLNATQVPCTVAERSKDVDLSPASSFLFGAAESNELSQRQEQMMQAEDTVQLGLLESWESLRQELVDLNSTVHVFATMVHNQRETVDRIEDNIITANENVQQGGQSLKKAALLKTTILPVVGAVIGGSLAGPVGLLVGLKAAGAFAFGGTILGYAGGRYYKKHRAKVIRESEEEPVEMRPLSTDRRSHSLSSLDPNASHESS